MHQAIHRRLLAAWMEAAERRDAIHDAKIAGFLARSTRSYG